MIDRFLRTGAGQNNLYRIAAVVLLGDPLYEDSVGARNAASVTGPGRSLTKTAARGVLPSLGIESYLRIRTGRPSGQLLSRG